MSDTKTIVSDIVEDQKNRVIIKDRPTPICVHIVCSGATTRDYLAANMGYERAIAKPDEIWSLNKSLRSLRANMGFVLDDWVGEYSKSRAYMTDIVNLTHEMPIITTVLDSEVRALVEQMGGNIDNVIPYPVEEIRDTLGEFFLERCSQGLPGTMTIADFVKQKGNSLLYLKNSVPLILAYAWYRGVESIYLFGADYTHPMSNRREADQPCAEYWCGFLEACGISLYLPHDTTLKSAREGNAIYGYGARQPFLG